jgi:MFS family permease
MRERPASSAAAAAVPSGDGTPMPAAHRKLIVACSLGALFEWYDFYLYGALAAVLAGRFFAALEARTALLVALLAFAAGFVVRPLGALLFGRLGDLIGRKYTFLVTLLLMGAATFAVGLLPAYETIGIAAPALLVALRLLQGLAIGGEYGGVATYVAEHAPARRRGFYTGWIQTTATLGLLLALLVIVGVRGALGDEAFARWGWRLPFLLSIVLLVLGIWMRLSLAESPPFRRLKQAGRASRRPLVDAFGRWSNLKLVLIALFGLVAGQAVVWYTGQFQALFFLTLVLKVDETTASLLSCTALAIGAPLIVGFAALSDRIGRKPIIIAGCVLAAASWFWLFGALAAAANPALVDAQGRVAVTLHADPRECSLPFDPIGVGEAGSGCDRARGLLAARSVRYTPAAHDGPASVTIDGARIAIGDDRALERIAAALDAAGYPTRADPARIDRVRVVLILVLLLAFVAMVYGPIAAMLVELFPTRVRCSSVSLPYHIGNGWFGGLLPATSFGIAAQTGQMLDGLWYPVSVAAAAALIALLFVSETKDRDIYANDG